MMVIYSKEMHFIAALRRSGQALTSHAVSVAVQPVLVFIGTTGGCIKGHIPENERGINPD